MSLHVLGVIIITETKFYDSYAAKCLLALKTRGVAVISIFSVDILKDLWTKNHWFPMIFTPPRIEILWKNTIFLDFESLDLRDYWSDFQKFTHKSYIHVEIRWFNMVSVHQNKNRKHFEHIQREAIWDFGKFPTCTTLIIIVPAELPSCVCKTRVDCEVWVWWVGP